MRNKSRVFGSVFAALLISSVTGLAQAQLPPVPVPAGTAAPGQAPARGGGRAAAPKKPSAPTPRWPDGHPMLGATPGQLGYWDAGFGGMTGKRSPNLPTNIDTSEVPFMPWSKALYEARQKTQQRSDPHARCLAPGGPRQFHTPYGLMMYEIPDAKRIFVISGGGPRSWRIIYMDGRPHPTGDDLNSQLLRRFDRQVGRRHARRRHGRLQ